MSMLAAGRSSRQASASPATRRAGAGGMPARKGGSCSDRPLAEISIWSGSDTARAYSDPTCSLGASLALGGAERVPGGAVLLVVVRARGHYTTLRRVLSHEGREGTRRWRFAVRNAPALCRQRPASARAAARR